MRVEKNLHIKSCILRNKQRSYKLKIHVCIPKKWLLLGICAMLKLFICVNNYLRKTKLTLVGYFEREL